MIEIPRKSLKLLKYSLKTSEMIKIPLKSLKRLKYYQNLQNAFETFKIP